MLAQYCLQDLCRTTTALRDSYKSSIPHPRARNLQKRPFRGLPGPKWLRQCRNCSGCVSQPEQRTKQFVGELQRVERGRGHDDSVLCRCGNQRRGQWKGAMHSESQARGNCARQSGKAMPNVRMRREFKRTENGGRGAGVGYSEVNYRSEKPECI